MTETISVREATGRDLDTLVDLSRRTFSDTFAASNTPEDLQEYLDTTLSRPRLAAEMISNHSLFLLAFVGSRDMPAGYGKCSVGSPAPAEPSASSLEIERLYVDRPTIGQGVGAALMRAMLKVAEERCVRSVWLGVWEHNRSAMQFYERWGFDVVGEKMFMLGSDVQRDLVMLKRLK